MIAFLRGTVAEALPQCLVLDVGGVGYEVQIPLSTFDRLNPVEGQQVTLKTHLHIRETAHVLYGFATDAERDIFRLLIERVSGIGPATAISILSGLNVSAFKAAVAGGEPCPELPCFSDPSPGRSWRRKPGRRHWRRPAFSSAPALPLPLGSKRP